MKGDSEEIIRDLDGLLALAPEWSDLWRRCPSATPFQSPAWLIPWWRAFAPGGLLVMAMRAQGRLVALAPFYLEASPSHRVLPVGISLSDYHDVLVDPSAPDGTLDALGGLCARAAAWTEWELPELAPEADALGLNVVEGTTREDGVCSLCPVLSLPPAGDTLESSLPATRRRKLAMARNRAARRGVVEIIRGDVGTSPGLLAALVKLHTARWNGRQQDGVLADERVLRFHHDALPHLLSAGLVRLYGLRIGGRSAAAYYGFLQGDRAYAYLSGFNPAFAFESPGTILLAHVLSEAIGEGAREFHFLRGQEPYKYEWGAIDRVNTRRVFRRAQS